jgi:hypothetical protein
LLISAIDIRCTFNAKLDFVALPRPQQADDTTRPERQLSTRFNRCFNRSISWGTPLACSKTVGNLLASWRQLKQCTFTVAACSGIVAVVKLQLPFGRHAHLAAAETQRLKQKATSCKSRKISEDHPAWSRPVHYTLYIPIFGFGGVGGSS